MKNSFLELQELEMEEFRRERQEQVRAGVRQRLRASEFMGDVLELFFPRMADTLSVMMGGEAIEGQDDYPTIPEFPEAPSASQRPSGPAGRTDIIR